MSSGSDSQKPRDWLLSSLRKKGILRSKSVEEAFLSVRREDFLWNREEVALAYLDEPLQLGRTGQTISAPHMVVMMLEELELHQGMRVLEVGAGSGYSAALIAHIVSRNQRAPQKLVVALEQNAILADFASRNIERVALDEWVDVIHADGSLGFPAGKDEEIYDRIVVAAAAPQIPYFSKRQLKSGGILEMPVGGHLVQSLTKLNKIGHKDEAEYKQRKIVSCTFVPLIKSRK